MEKGLGEQFTLIHQASGTKEQQITAGINALASVETIPQDVLVRVTAPDPITIQQQSVSVKFRPMENGDVLSTPTQMIEPLPQITDPGIVATSAGNDIYTIPVTALFSPQALHAADGNVRVTFHYETNASVLATREVQEKKVNAQINMPIIDASGSMRRLMPIVHDALKAVDPYIENIEGFAFSSYVGGDEAVMGEAIKTISSVPGVGGETTWTETIDDASGNTPGFSALFGVFFEQILGNEIQSTFNRKTHTLSGESQRGDGKEQLREGFADYWGEISKDFTEFTRSLGLDVVIPIETDKEKTSVGKIDSGYNPTSAGGDLEKFAHAIAPENLSAKNQQLYAKLQSWKGRSFPIITDGMFNGSTTAKKNFEVFSKFFAVLLKQYDITFDFIHLTSRTYYHTTPPMFDVGSSEEVLYNFAIATGGKYLPVDTSTASPRDDIGKKLLINTLVGFFEDNKPKAALLEQPSTVRGPLSATVTVGSESKTIRIEETK